MPNNATLASVPVPPSRRACPLDMEVTPRLDFRASRRSKAEAVMAVDKSVSMAPARQRCLRNRLL